MRTNLSSQISLSHVARKLYKPEDVYELTRVTRMEKVKTTIYETGKEGAIAVAQHIAELIAQHQKEGKKFVLSMMTGRSMQDIFAELIRLHQEGLSFRNVVLVVGYEYYPLASEDAGCLGQLEEQFISKVGILPANVIAIPGTLAKEEIIDACAAYERTIQDLGGIDLMLLGIGRGGNIAFNEPGSQFNSETRLVLLDNNSRADASEMFGNTESVPVSAITIGIDTILKAREILLVAWGEHKAAPVARAIEQDASPACPASALQLAQNAHIALDLSAADRLTRISKPWTVTSCEWDDQLIRKAIVWLCEKTDKPILKLTNKDYNDYGLAELITLFGSAYNCNIKVFNDLQHTITGWPGGKPNADDSNRPERAKPFPKNVVIFSPHPDDDVISMGGTLIRLVHQGHEVHVAYETSGDLAVHDDVVLQHMDAARQLGFGDRFDEVKYIIGTKKPGEPEPKELLALKAAIRRSEARGAVRSFGLDDDHNVHFLNLPFYESGGVTKLPRTQKDLDIIKELILELKPDQIYMAGDLADPHGTHRVCTEAALEAIEQLKEEGNEWLDDTTIWLYRGAWMEWELWRVDMAVPLSPDELIEKRHAIFRHLSQKDIVPFPGDDPREFWQRAEERTQNTAKLYNDLGMAEYQAIEVFLRLK